MTTTTRRVLVVAGVAAALVVGGATIATTGPTEPPPATCARTGIPGEWRCTFPTPGRTAAVYVSAWEDGSARAVAIDPDTP